MDKPTPLARILGLGFGIAMVFGGTVGVGILRLPGTLAATLGDSRLVLVFWIVGGVYALLGAMSVAELAAMLPRAGGFYVYARRAFGSGAGFVVGWSDWINEVAALAYGSMTAMTFLASLWPAAAHYARRARCSSSPRSPRCTGWGCAWAARSRGSSACPSGS